MITFLYERPQQGEQYQSLEHHGWKKHKACIIFFKKHACRSASLEHGQAATPEAMLGHLPV